MTGNKTTTVVVLVCFAAVVCGMFTLGVHLYSIVDSHMLLALGEDDERDAGTGMRRPMNNQGIENKQDFSCSSALWKMLSVKPLRLSDVYINYIFHSYTQAHKSSESIYTCTHWVSRKNVLEIKEQVRLCAMLLLEFYTGPKL